MIENLKEFNRHKLQPTSQFFRQLLENDKKKFDIVHRELVSKKQKIDIIVARFNKAVNFQGCVEKLGRSSFTLKLGTFPNLRIFRLRIPKP